MVKKAVLHHRAKLCDNWSNCCRDMLIYHFLQNGGRPPSWIHLMHIGTTQKEYLVVFIVMQNVVGTEKYFQ